ncbi:MAG: HDOD domain-containing protein [Thermodesulfobacteriota bacterium]
MTELSNQSHRLLMQLFGLGSMQDLPAMSDHVRELIGLIGNPRATSAGLTNAILKDYALTTKMLQIVNSAYYMRNEPITSINRAVTIIGLTALKNLALGIALFEEFRKQGREADKVLRLMTMSFVSATQGNLLTQKKKYPVLPEDAFVCTLLHHLGRMVILVYLPELHAAYEQLVNNGYSGERAAKEACHGLTFTDIGREIARYWNFSEIIVRCMETNPRPPRDQADTETLLQNIAAFNNQLTETLLIGTDLDLEELIYRYGDVLSVTKNEARELVHRSVETAATLSEPIRHGLHKLAMRERLIALVRDQNADWRPGG